MKKILFKKITISDLRLVILGAFFLLALFNGKIIKSDFRLCLADPAFSKIAIFLAEIVTAMLVTTLSFLLFSFNKILLKCLLVLGFFISTIGLYVLNKYGITLDGSMISNALSSLGHINEVVDYSIIFYFAIFTILPAIIIFRLKISKTKIKKKLIISLSSLAILGAFHYAFLPAKIFESTFTNYSPINYIISFYNYCERFHGQIKQGKNRISLNKLYDFQYNKKLDNLNVVLIIGESLRASHLGLNGYERNTTPNLEKMPNFLNFTLAASFNTTTSSITSMLSHRTKAEFLDIPPEKSIVSLYKDLGFKTHWYSAQSSKEFGNGMLTIMASEADDYFFRDRIKSSRKSNKIYDKDLLPYLQKTINEGGNNFIVLHSFGSHIRFYERYTKEFQIFKPECMAMASSCPKEEVANSYDNSVLYTDSFVSDVIDSIKNTNSILFFVSDHGIFLGEDGIYANGNTSQVGMEANRVPMFLYMTDGVLKSKAYKNKFKVASKKTKLEDLTHDNLFDTMLDCSNIDSKLLNRGLSLCR